MVIITALKLLLAWYAFLSSTSAETNYIPVLLGTDITLNCPETHGNRFNCSDIFWSKDGEILQNQTEQTFTLVTVNFTDDGNYSCNKCGTVQEYLVVVGETPETPPVAGCLTSPNTTIWCHTQVDDTTYNEKCLIVHAISLFGSKRLLSTNCVQSPRGKQVNASINLDYQMANRFEFQTTVRNDFGVSPSTVVYYLSQKVIPDPPMISMLETTGPSYFDVSFDLPDSWETVSYLEYGYRIHHLNRTTHQRGEFSSGERTVNFRFRLEETPYIFSLLCLQIRIRFGSFYARNWSNYSEEVCNYTETSVPSRGPEDFRLTKDEINGNFRDVSFSWSPPPEEHRNGKIEKYVLLVEEVRQGWEPQQALNETLFGNSTNWNLPGNLRADQTYVASLSAWTSKGDSPPAVVVLAPFTKGKDCSKDQSTKGELQEYHVSPNLGSDLEVRNPDLHRVRVK